MNQASSNEQLDALQALRGVAALSVVLMHFKEWMAGFAPGLAAVARYGYVGVDIFFLISGFIIFHTTRGPQARHAGSFLVRRLCRVVLPAWAAMALLALIKPPYLIDLVRGLAFLPRETGHPPFFGHAFLIVAWTLSYELVFYVMFALTLLLPWSRDRRGWACAILLVLVMLAGQVVAGHLTLDATQTLPVGRATTVDQFSFWPLLTMMSSPMLMEFVVGLGLAAAYGWHGGLPFMARGAAIATIGVTLAVLGSIWPGLEGHGPNRAGLFALGVVLFTLGIQARLTHERGAERQRWFTVLVWLGGCSYSLYLFHPLLKVLMQPLASRCAGASLALLTVVALVACVLLATLMHRWVELPAQALGKRCSRRLVGRVAAHAGVSGAV